MAYNYVSGHTELIQYQDLFRGCMINNPNHELAGDQLLKEFQTCPPRNYDRSDQKTDAEGSASYDVRGFANAGSD